MEVEVNQTRTKHPNDATASLWNLSPSSIQFLRDTPELTLQILAGEVVPSLLFRGDVKPRGIRVESSPPDVVTEIRAGAGRTQFQVARVSLSYPPGTVSTLILADILAQLAGSGLVTGFVDPTLVPYTYASGFSFVGFARDALDEVLTDMGATWTVTGGFLEVYGELGFVPDAAIVVSAETGLRTVPSRIDNGIAAETELSPGIRPGRTVSVVSLRDPSLTGFYVVTKATHRAGSRGLLWSTEFEAKPLE